VKRYNSERTGGQQLSYSKARRTAGLLCPGPRRPDSNRHLSAGQAIALPVELLRGRAKGLSRRRHGRKVTKSDSRLGWRERSGNTPDRTCVNGGSLPVMTCVASVDGSACCIRSGQPQNIDAITESR
jgi:hypothetical protein